MQFNMQLGNKAPAKRRRGTPGRNRQQPQQQDGQQVVVVTQPPSRLSRLTGRQQTVQQVPVIPAEQWRQPARVKPVGGSTLHRNRYQWRPLAAAAGVLAVAAVGRVLIWFDAPPVKVAAIVGGAGAVGLMLLGRYVTGHIHSRWRRRVWTAVVAASVWLVAAILTGLSNITVALLILATVGLSARWWAEHRRGYPDAPPRATRPEDVGPAKDDIVASFTRYARRKGGPAEGCTLTDADINDARSSYTMQIRPGQDSLNKMLQKQDLLATSVQHDPEDLVIEKHPEKKATLKFTVITQSPVKDTQVFTEPGWREDGHDAWIEAGTWADGDGRVRIPVLSHNSAWNAAFLATMGGGKSTLLNLLALGLRASGRAMFWYLDGKGGASSPLLRDWADWAPTADTKAGMRTRGLDVLAAIEAVIEARQQQMKAEGLEGITPTAERPLLILVIDECHVFFDGNDRKVVQRWNEAVRVMRSLAIGVWASTQFPKINSFGNESDLKEGLGGRTIIAGRMRNPNAGGLLNVTFNPASLPTGGGWWFIDAEDDRSAMWRSDYIDGTRTPGQQDSQADDWFRRLPGGQLEEKALARMPKYYVGRAEAGDDEPVSAGDGATETLPTASDWQPQWPTLRPVPDAAAEPEPAPSPATGLAGSQLAVYEALRAGAARPAEVQEATGLGQSQVYKLIRELTDAGLVRQARRGRYEVV